MRGLKGTRHCFDGQRGALRVWAQHLYLLCGGWQTLLLVLLKCCLHILLVSRQALTQGTSILYGHVGAADRHSRALGTLRSSHSWYMSKAAAAVMTAAHGRQTARPSQSCTLLAAHAASWQWAATAHDAGHGSKAGSLHAHSNTNTGMPADAWPS